jgi:hypothetical protein
MFIATQASPDSVCLRQVAGGGGIPLATAFRPAMQDLDQAWYEASQRFGPYNYHPDRCEDWNLESGGNTDLGEPLVAPFAGVVIGAYEWSRQVGQVIQILGVTVEGQLICWSGWHLQSMEVEAGDVVDVGQPIGAIGNAGGYYSGAHLHEQICIVNLWGLPAPATFAADRRYAWQQPSRFYIDHGVDEALMARLVAYDGE